VDLPGVEPAAVRVIIKGGAALIIGEKTRGGEKAPLSGRAESTFHLVERGFGRFARTVRFGRACDAATARATLSDGELRISIGRSIQIPIQPGIRSA
jgi:HSP20 family molecular chaperone IbpA